MVSNMSGAFISGKVASDNFMYRTVKDIVYETLSGMYNESFMNDVTDKVYVALYEQTDEKGKSWNCSMIDKLIMESI